MATNRYNASNTQGTTQPVTNVTNSVTASTTVTNFPHATAITVVRPTLTGAMITASVATTDTLERDSDGCIWDVTAGIAIPPEATSLVINDMLSVL